MVEKTLWTIDFHYVCVRVGGCVQVSVRHFDALSRRTGNFCLALHHLGPLQAPPHRRFPLSCRLSLLNTERLISSDWQPCSHLALRSWCPRVATSRKAIVEVPLWLSLSFSQYPAPADSGWKVPTAALNYESHSALAIYTTQHREPFPAEMPLAADYWGNISCTATRMVTVRRQFTCRCFGIRLDDWNERRGRWLMVELPFLSHGG